MSNEEQPALTEEEKIERIKNMSNSIKSRFKNETDEDGKDTKYYSRDELKESLDEVRYAQGKDKAVAGAKLIGKSLFNVGRFAIKEAVPTVLDNMAENAEKNLKNR